MAQCQTVKLPKTKVERVVVKSAGRVATRKGDITRLLSEDVTQVLAHVTNCEIEQQERLNNPMTHLRLNGKAANRVTIRQSGRRARGGEYLWKSSVLFGNAESMLPAAKEALGLMVGLTRIRSGRAQNSYRIYLGSTGILNHPGRFMGYNVAGISSIDKAALSSTSVISIVGPWVPYARKLFWSPSDSGTKVKRFPTRNLRGTNIRIRGGYIGTKGIHTNVKQKMRGRAPYKALSFGDAWFEMPTSPVARYPRRKPDARIPAVTIKFKKSGRIS